MLNGIVTQEQAKIQKLRLNYSKLSRPARMQIFADRFMSSGHPAATSTRSKGGKFQRCA